MNKKIFVAGNQALGDPIIAIEGALSDGCKLIILKLDNLDDASFEDVATKSIAMCKENEAKCVIYNRLELAKRLQYPFVHLSYDGFMGITGEQSVEYPTIGVTVSSVAQAEECEEMGASYLLIDSGVKNGQAIRDEAKESVFIPIYVENEAKPMRPMRRADRQVTDRDELLRIMGECDVCRLALNDDGYPYILPLNFGLIVDGDTVELYFHSALTGAKFEIIAKDNRASFEMDCKHELKSDEGRGYCTMMYESVIGRGRVYVLEDEDKKKALDTIVRQYHPEGFEYNPAAMARTAVYKLVVETMTGKIKS